MENKKESINFRESFEKLYKAEKEFNLFSFTLGGIPLWVYLRDKAHLTISNFNSYNTQSAAFQKINLLNLIKRIFYFLFNFYKLSGNDIILFANERHLELDFKNNTYYNPYAELIFEMNPGLKNVLIFEFPIPMTQKYKRTKYKRYLPLDPLLVTKQIFSPLAAFFNRGIRKEFSQKINSSGLWSAPDSRELLKFGSYCAYNIIIYSTFLKIIKFLNPKARLIYGCMGGFDKFPEVIEVQPALIIGFHSQYIFPKIGAMDKYLENRKMVVISEDSKELLAANGYSRENITVVDNPKIKYYFLFNIDENFFAAKRSGFPKKITIIGNWGGNTEKIFKDFVLEIEKNKETLRDWEVSMILHPTQKNNYKNLNLSKVKVFENHEASLWKMLSESVISVNVSSTVLEESTYFGCFNVILNDEKFDDQKDYIELLCKNYPYKVVINPKEFFEWFKSNEDMLVHHSLKKLEIMHNNYNYFSKNRPVAK